MTSEASSSLQSISFNSESAQNTRGRPRTSPIWTYTRTALEHEAKVDRNQRKLAYCSYCTGDKVYSSSILANLGRHLRTKHQIDPENVESNLQNEISSELQRLFQKALIAGQENQLQGDLLENFLTQSVIDEALTSLIVVRSLSFRLIESKEFHTFCQALNPRAEKFLYTAHSTVPQRINQLYQAQKDVVRKKLQSSVSSIHLTLDIWTAPNQLLLLGICAHFVERDNNQLSKALLGLRTVANHGGETQFKALLPVLQDYGIVQKLGGIMCDNASSNDTLCRTIGIYLQEQEIDWDPSFRRLRCIGHIINLAVRAFLFPESQDQDLDQDLDQEGFEDRVETQNTFRRLGALGKLRNLILHTRSSPGRTKEFQDLAGRMIPLCNRTRWNSWFEMIRIADEHEGHLHTYTTRHLETLEADHLSLDDWKELRTIQRFLQPFSRATLQTEGDAATIDRILFTMDILIRHLDRSLSQATDQRFRTRIEHCWKVFDKYYSKTDSSPLYTTALILHPYRRLKYIRTNWKKEWIRKMIPKAKDLWISYRESSLLSQALLPYEATLEEDQELDDFDLIAQNLERYTRSASQDEWDDFTEGEPYDIGYVRALEWWCQDQQRTRWPRLSLMAIDILSIPAMSAEPERVFSGARRTISWERSRMSAEVLEKLECLKHWSRTKVSQDELEVND